MSAPIERDQLDGADITRIGANLGRGLAPSIQEGLDLIGRILWSREEIKRLREIEEAARAVPGAWDDFLHPPGIFSEGNDWRNAKEDAGLTLNVAVNRLRELLDGTAA